MVGKSDGGHMTPDDQRAIDAVSEVAESSGVNPRSMLAPYVQIALLLRGSIVTRSLPVGSPLPSDAELVERFGVSRETVRRAIGLLRDLGLAETRRGVGSVVARTPEVQRVAVAPGSRVVVRMPRPNELPEGLGYAVYVVSEPGREPRTYDTGATLLVFESP
jgi:DNA-binding transcriptional ArsR family regulator